MTRWRGALGIAAFAFAVGQGLGMSCQPPPDPDSTPAGSQGLALETWHRDALDCGRRVGDCADWFHVDTPGVGALHVDVAKVEDDRDPPAFSVIVGDASGQSVAEEASEGRTRIGLRHPPGDGYLGMGRYTLAVRTPEEGDGALDYELRVRFSPKPRPVVRPPKPRFEPVRASLLEVEAGETVLIDRGSRAGIARGQRGRLLQDGRKIAEIEILDVYPDGSRAAIRGGLGGALTPATVVEIDVPR